MSIEISNREKNAAALSSVAAAFFLTALKLVVGFFSGSIGILAEAAHSGLDFAAAIVTYIAVRTASKPPDSDHPYGHGKIENLSALIETLLLFVTCAWIIYESVTRLVAKEVHVDASVWAFAVMIISIVVDISRSRMLYRVAKKHRSQALEADALHFSTDIWSSAVVVVGLAGVVISHHFPALEWMQKTDAVAALFVAGLVLKVTGTLGGRTIHALLDATPDGDAIEKIKTTVEKIEGVYDCHAVRARHSGPVYFVDLHITVDGEKTLRSVHALADHVEDVVREILPDADVTVHPEPHDPKADPAASSDNPAGAT